MKRTAAWALVLTGGLVLVGLFALQLSLYGGDAEATGEVSVHMIVGNRSGYVFFNETLHLENATALLALDTAAEAGDFTYHVTYYPGFGSREAGAFVDMIGDEWAERGDPDGWIYRIARDGDWIRPDRSAALYPLKDGDTLVWAWSATWDGP